MKVGDLVVAKYDLQRGLKCVGVVLAVEEKNNDTHVFAPCAKIAWCSTNNPIGWWSFDKLFVWKPCPLSESPFRSPIWGHLG